jgi:hypothetical protein
VTARFFEEGEAPGHRVLVQTAHATKEDEEAPRKCFTGDEAPGRPAMARRRDPPGGGTHTKVGMGEGLGRGKKNAAGTQPRPLKARERGGSNSRANWPWMAVAAITAWWGGGFGS